MSRNNNWNPEGLNRNHEYADSNSRSKSGSRLQGEHMTYAKEQCYGYESDSLPSPRNEMQSRHTPSYEGELNQFERGRKASRVYDREYTGYRSIKDGGGTGYERESWNTPQNGNRPVGHGSDYGSAPRSDDGSSWHSRYTSGQNRGQNRGQNFEQDFGQQTGGPQMFDGRNQGYRNPEAQYRASSAAGKGPKGWKRTDERIHEDVCQILEHDHLVDATEIEVTVKDGIVTLSGHTETRPVKRRAEDLIESVSGVRDVRNELAVDQSFFQQAKEFFLGDSSAEKTTLKTGTVPKH